MTSKKYKPSYSSFVPRNTLNDEDRHNKPREAEDSKRKRTQQDGHGGYSATSSPHFPVNKRPRHGETSPSARSRQNTRALSSKSPPRVVRDTSRHPSSSALSNVVDLENAPMETAPVAIRDKWVADTGFKSVDRRMRPPRKQSHHHEVPPTKPTLSHNLGAGYVLDPGNDEAHESGSYTANLFSPALASSSRLDNTKAPSVNSERLQKKFKRDYSGDPSHDAAKHTLDDAREDTSDSPDELANEHTYPDYISGKHSASIQDTSKSVRVSSQDAAKGSFSIDHDDSTDAEVRKPKAAISRTLLHPHARQKANPIGDSEAVRRDAINLQEFGRPIDDKIQLPFMHIFKNGTDLKKRPKLTVAARNCKAEDVFPCEYDLILYCSDREKEPKQLMLINTDKTVSDECLYVYFELIDCNKFSKFRQWISDSIGETIVEECDLDSNSLKTGYTSLHRSPDLRKSLDLLIRKATNAPVSKPRVSTKIKAHESRHEANLPMTRRKEKAVDIGQSRVREIDKVNAKKDDIIYEQVEEVVPLSRSRRNAKVEPIPVRINRFDLAVKSGELEKWTEPLSLAPIGRSRATVEWDDLSRLNDEEFLNDNLISYFLLNEQATSYGRRRKDEVYFFNTYFYETLTSNVRGKGINYEKVKRWTKNEDIFSYKYIVVPINKNLHWYCAIICNVDQIEWAENGDGNEDAASDDKDAPHAASRSPGRDAHSAIDLVDVQDQPDDQQDASRNSNLRDAVKKASRRGGRPGIRDPVIVTLDSLDNVHPEVARSLKDYLSAEASAKLGRVLKQDPRGITAKGMPMQTNLTDCGLYLITYIRKFLNDPPQFVEASLSSKAEDRAHFWGEFDAQKFRDRCLETISQEYARQHHTEPMKISNIAKPAIDLEDSVTAIEPPARAQNIASAALTVTDSFGFTNKLTGPSIFPVPDSPGDGAAVTSTQSPTPHAPDPASPAPPGDDDMLMSEPGEDIFSQLSAAARGGRPVDTRLAARLDQVQYSHDEGGDASASSAQKQSG